MKSKHLRFSLLLVVLALTAQLSLATPSLRVGQNANSSTTMGEATRPMPRPCQRRCRVSYGMCLRRADGNPGRRRACMMRYRNCLRHCGR